MRDYAKVAPFFWTRGSGKRLRGAGDGQCDTQLVGMYLLTCASSNMVGLYYLPIALLCHETGVSEEGARKALQRCSEADFAHYDYASEIVWVPNGAAYQIGEDLDRKDKRRIGVMKELDRYGKHPFVQRFFDLYAEPYHLEKPPWTRSPSEAPPKPLRSQEQEQKQKQEQKRESTAAPRPLARSVRNSTDDGAFGLAVTAFADGVKSVTGTPFLLPAPGSAELAKLVNAIVQLCPDPAARVEWAQAKGASWAGQRQSGDRLNVHAFVDWLNSKEEPRESCVRRAGSPVQPTPAAGPIWKPATFDDTKGTGTQ